MHALLKTSAQVFIVCWVLFSCAFLWWDFKNETTFEHHYGQDIFGALLSAVLVTCVYLIFLK